MEPGQALSLCRELRGDRCLFGYRGQFSDEHSARLIELAEAVSDGSSAAQATRGRLGYVMVEAFQNIIRHRADPAGPDRSLFVLRCGTLGQTVVATNAVTLPQMRKLDGLLTVLRGKGPEELKSLFMEGIQRASKPGVRGAGLGLIEMVRRSGGKFAWRFAPVDADHAQFTITFEMGELRNTQVIDGIGGQLPDLAGPQQWPLFYAGKCSAGVQNVLFNISRVGAAARALLGGACDLLENVPAAFLVVEDGQAPRLSLGGMMSAEQAGWMAELFPPEKTLGNFRSMRTEDGSVAYVDLPL